MILILKPHLLPTACKVIYRQQTVLLCRRICMDTLPCFRQLYYHILSMLLHLEGYCLAIDAAGAGCTQPVRQSDTTIKTSF